MTSHAIPVIGTPATHTKGDLLVWNGTDWVTHAVPADGKAPIADSTQADGWRDDTPALGGWHKIAEVVVAVATATIDFPSIPSTYKRLKLLGSARSSAAATTDNLLLSINGDTTDANYDRQLLASSSSTTTSSATAGTSRAMSLIVGTGAASVSQYGVFEATFYDVQGGGWKNAVIDSMAWTTRGGGGITIRKTGMGWASTATINEITLSLTTGPNFSVGTKVGLFGIVAAG